MNGIGGVRIEAFEMVLAGAVFVVVPLDAGDAHVPDDLQTFPGARVVSYHVAEADNVGGVLCADILQGDLKGINVAVDVCDNGVFHLGAGNFKIAKLDVARLPILHVRP